MESIILLQNKNELEQLTQNVNALTLEHTNEAKIFKKEITALKTAIGKRKDELKRPILDEGKKIDTAYKTAINTLETLQESCERIIKHEEIEEQKKLNELRSERARLILLNQLSNSIPSYISDLALLSNDDFKKVIENAEIAQIALLNKRIVELTEFKADIPEDLKTMSESDYTQLLRNAKIKFAESNTVKPITSNVLIDTIQSYEKALNALDSSNEMNKKVQDYSKHYFLNLYNFIKNNG